jgi:hypothetical protein
MRRSISKQTISPLLQQIFISGFSTILCHIPDPNDITDCTVLLDGYEGKKPLENLSSMMGGTRCRYTLYTKIDRRPFHKATCEISENLYLAVSSTTAMLAVRPPTAADNRGNKRR